MSETKSWGFDKPKTKTHLISFRADDKHYVMLEKLFETLQIYSRKNRMTDKMLLLIERVDNLNRTLNQKIVDNEKQISTLKAQLAKYEDEKHKLLQDAQKMVVANRMEQARQAAQPKPEPIKSEPLPPIPGTQKPSVVSEHKEATPKKQPEPRLRMGASEAIKTASPRPQMPDDKGLIACPDDAWVTNQDCEKCRTTTFKKYSNCFSERVKNPNGLIFKVSTPKPQLNGTIQ
jgi:hypothetical protein